MSDNKDIYALFAQIDGNKYRKAIEAPSKATDPMFTTKDILDSDDIIAKLVKDYFIKNNISERKFRDMHKRYEQRCGVRATKITNDANNLISTMKAGERITWRKFVEQILPALGQRLANVELTLVDDNGNVTKTSLSDVRQRVSKEFPVDIPNLKSMAINTVDGVGQPHTFKQENTDDGENTGV
jgi:hypothetical protein